MREICGHSSCHCLRVVGNSEGDMLHSSCHCLRVVGNSEGVMLHFSCSLRKKSSIHVYTGFLFGKFQVVELPTLPSILDRHGRLERMPFLELTLSSS